MQNVESSIRLCLWDISLRCNKRCPYCFADCGPHRAAGPTTGQARLFVEQLARLGFHTVMISGGEPFLRDDLEMLVKQGDELGMHMGMITNGSLCTFERLSQIRSNVSVLSISLDAPEQELNDALRFPGSFGGATRTCKIARDLRIPFFIYVTVQHRNYPLLSKMYNLGKQLGAKGIYFKGIFDGNGGGFSLESLWQQLKPSLPRGSGLRIDTRCFAYGKSLYLDPSGILCPCQMVATHEDVSSLGPLLSIDPYRFNLILFGGSIRASKVSCPFLFHTQPGLLLCSSPASPCPMAEI